MTKRRLFTAALLVLIALFAALLLLSKHGLSVTRLTLEFSGLPRGCDGFKIVQLSDLHGSEFGQDNARLIEAVAAEEPELIALTGDFLDEGEAGRELPGVEALVRELVQLVGLVAVVLYHIGEQSDRLFDVANIFMAVVGMSFVHPEVPPCVVLWRICPPPMEL